MRMANELELVALGVEGRKPGLYIDGVMFPYYISQDATASYGPGEQPKLSIGLYGGRVMLTDSDRTLEVSAGTDDADAQAWFAGIAARRGCRHE